MPPPAVAPEKVFPGAIAYGLPPPAAPGLPLTAAPPETEYGGGLSADKSVIKDQTGQLSGTDVRTGFFRMNTHGAPGL